MASIAPTVLRSSSTRKSSFEAFERSIMGKDKPRHQKPPTPRQRLFTVEFELGDHVYVIREDHGWHEGGVDGFIVEMTPTRCVVYDEENGGGPYYINHPRDINKTTTQVGPNRRHQIIAKYKAEHKHGLE